LLAQLLGAEIHSARPFCGQRPSAAAAAAAAPSGRLRRSLARRSMRIRTGRRDGAKDDRLSPLSQAIVGQTSGRLGASFDRIMTPQNSARNFLLGWQRRAQHKARLWPP